MVFGLPGHMQSRTCECFSKWGYYGLFSPSHFKDPFHSTRGSAESPVCYTYAYIPWKSKTIKRIVPLNCWLWIPTKTIVFTEKNIQKIVFGLPGYIYIYTSHWYYINTCIYMRPCPESRAHWSKRSDYAWSTYPPPNYPLTYPPEK